VGERELRRLIGGRSMHRSERESEQCKDKRRMLNDVLLSARVLVARVRFDVNIYGRCRGTRV
jgi:hypothetical protein